MNGAGMTVGRVEGGQQPPRLTAAARPAIQSILGLVMMAALAGCGGSHDQSVQQETRVVNWNVAANSVNELERTRVWEICGGAIICTNRIEAPLTVPAPGGFIGSATESQASCYRMWSGSRSLITTTATACARNTSQAK
jgi:hypothetical protein